MSPYFLVAMIVVAIAVVIGVPAWASRTGCCAQGETRWVCFREWMKAFAPPATLFGVCFAALAAVAAWQNLTEVQKGSAVRVSEILRQRLIALEREAAEFNTIGSKSVELINLYKTLHDPSEDIRAWRSGNDPQLIDLVRARSQLNEQFDYLNRHLLDVDTADLASTRGAYKRAIIDLLVKMGTLLFPD